MGTGVAQGVKLIISGGETLGLPSAVSLGAIAPGSEANRKLIYVLSDRIEGEHRLKFYLETADGFMSREKAFIVLAKDYQPPNIVFDYALRDANGNMKLEPGEEGTLYVVLKNLGGDARDVRVRVKLPSYVKVLSGETELRIPVLPAGESKKFGIGIIVPQAYARARREIEFSVDVKAREFERKKGFALALNEYVQPPEEVVLKPRVERAEAGYVAASDVDKKVKALREPKVFREDAVALVIGIGAYKNLPSALYSEADAILMGNLLKRIYRIRSEVLLNGDATYLAIRDKVSRLCGEVSGKEVYVFYSGHGFPKGGKPAIVPYDAPSNLSEEALISLSWMVSEFKKAGVRKVVVLSDACYSGYTKEGVRLLKAARPGILILKGFSVGDVFASATSKEGKSYSDKKRRHGIFTYFVAKALLFGDKDGDGAIEKEEFREYLNEARRYAQKLGYTDEKPFFEARTEVVIRR